LFYFGKYNRKNIEELEKLYQRKEEDFLAAKEKLSETKHKVKLEIEAFKNKKRNWQQLKEKLGNLKKVFGLLAFAPNYLQK